MTNHGVITTNADTVKKYRLGVVLDPLPGDERFRGWLAIPYLTPRGVRGIKFRNLESDNPKMGCHNGQPVRLFNTQAYFADDGVIGIAEGEIDAIVATERLGLPTMGVPGASVWTSNRGTWGPLFKNFRQVLILRDGDADGRRLADTITETLKLRARVIDMPEGEDVSSMVAKGRYAELLKQFGDGDNDLWKTPQRGPMRNT